MRCSNSDTRRLLPTPDSPPTRTSRGRRLAASPSASSSSASSPVRPTKWLLVSLARMAEVSPPGGRSRESSLPPLGYLVAGRALGRSAEIVLSCGGDCPLDLGVHVSLLSVESTPPTIN